MFLEPSFSRRRRHRSGRGFTLIELVVVVLIIGITAALATPAIVGQMRERRSRDTAQRIALVYATARARAMGRGSAVLVRYNKTTGFRVFDSVEGAFAVARSADNCWSAPGRGCLTTNWGNPINTRQITSFQPVANNVTVAAADPGGTPTDNINVCFTPAGRSFASYNTADPGVAMAGSASFAVKLGTTGLSRTVALLPNGNARLAL